MFEHIQKFDDKNSNDLWAKINNFFLVYNNLPIGTYSKMYYFINLKIVLNYYILAGWNGYIRLEN